MKVLNLYAGVGGNRKLWTDCEVTAVEYDPKIAAVYQKLHPGDDVVVGDAHQYLLEHFAEYDMIWASPPCPSHSSWRGSNQSPRYPDMGLYQEILFLKHKFNGLWVAENVKPYYTPLIPNTFNIGRHIFWSNFYVSPIDAPDMGNLMYMQKSGDRERLHDWLGIHFDETLYIDDNHCPLQVLRNCVHPEIGQHIMNWATGAVKDQDDLFG